MNKLRQHINSLSIEEQNEFATSCGTSISYIRKILSSNGKLFFGPAICSRIEQRTNCFVTRKDLRPNDWREIWPDLATQESAKSQEAA